MATFDVLGWLEAYRSGDVQDVRIEQPTETGACWSRTSNLEGGQYKYGDRTGLLPYRPCSTPCSLAEGFPEKFVQKPKEGSAHVERILRALKVAGVAFEDFTLISFRNNINKICNTMTDNSAPWAVDACLLSDYPNTTFLNIHHTEEKEYPDSERYCYYGYKFETLCTGGGQEAMVDATSEFATVFDAQMQDMKCAIAAEIDCYDPNSTSSNPTISLMELKTARVVESDRQQKNAQRFKYPKWWIQSFIVGVPQIVIGYWSKDGTLTTTTSIRTEDLPLRAMEGVPSYKRHQVLPHLHHHASVLSWIQGLLREEPDSHYRFVYCPERRLITAQLCSNGELTVDFYAVHVERETRTYFETRMDVPQLPPLPNDVPAMQLERREMRMELTEKLVDSTSLAFRKLREDLRPIPIPRAAETTPRLEKIATVIGKREEDLTRCEFEMPITCCLSDPVDSILIHGAQPRCLDEDAPVKQLDMLDLVSSEMMSEKREAEDSGDLQRWSREAFSINDSFEHWGQIEMPLSLRTVCLTDPAIVTPGPVEVNDAVLHGPESLDLEPMSSCHDLKSWMPEKLSSSKATPLENRQHKTFSLAHVGNGDVDADPQPFQPLCANLADPPFSAVAYVLEEVLEEAPEVEISALRPSFYGKAKDSFAELLFEYINQELDIQTLPSVTWPTDDPVTRDKPCMPSVSSALRPIAHLDLYLRWNLYEDASSYPHISAPLVPDLEMKVPLPRMKQPHSWTDAFCTAKHPTDLLMHKPLPSRLTKAASLNPRSGYLATEETAAEERESPSSDVQYLFDLRGSSLVSKTMDVTSTHESAKSAARPAVPPPPVAETHCHLQKIHYLDAEMAASAREILSKVHVGHASLLAGCSSHLKAELSTDLFDLCCFQDSLFLHRMKTVSDSVLLEIKVLRETSWYLLHLGISSAYHHLKKATKDLPELRDSCSCYLQDLRAEYRQVLNGDIADHSKDVKLKEILSSRPQREEKGGRKFCLLSDAAGFPSLLRKFPALQQLSRTQPTSEKKEETEWERPVDVLATHQDFCRIASEQVSTSVGEFDVLIEVAPSMHGPSLDMLLQQEALREDRYNTRRLMSVICLRSQEPLFIAKTALHGDGSIMSQSEATLEQERSETQNPKRIKKAANSNQFPRSDLQVTGERLRAKQHKRQNLSSSPETSFIREVSAEFVTTTRMNEISREDIDLPLEDHVGNGKAEASDPSLENGRSSLPDWNSFKFEEKNKSCLSQPTKPSINERTANAKQAGGSRRHLIEHRTSQDIKWDGMLDADWNWDLDLFEADDDDALFDSTFSTGLDSMTEISGLEETSSRDKDTGFDWDLTSSFRGQRCNEHNQESTFLQEQSFSQNSYYHSMEDFSATDSLRERKRAPLRRNGLFPDYRRLKRTRTLKKSQQSRWIHQEY